jgi:hypothetical protein
MKAFSLLLVHFLLACTLVMHTSFLSAQTLNTTSPLHYIPLQTPCRAVDTRLTGGPIAAGTTQNFNPAGGACSIPTPSDGTIVYAMNVTVVPHGSLGYLTVWPSGGPTPVVSTLNSLDGRVKANAAIVAGGSGGQISVYADGTTDVVLDVSGYFTTDPASYVFVPITPCRVVDTRINNGTSFGAPSLVAGQQRTFALANSNCNLPAAALAQGGAVSMNVTTVPIGGAGVSYVTVWGTDASEPQTPNISTLNVPTGTVTANAAMVTLNPSTSESVSVFATNNTDLVMDVTGYFAPASLVPTGLSLYIVPPCRVLDTRNGTGAIQATVKVPFSNSSCNAPQAAQAYVMNATVVPPGTLGALVLWPDNVTEPVASTLNALDGSITSNMAIIGTTDGSIDASAFNPTQLVLDISGYFALAPNANLPSVVFIGDDVTADWATSSPAFVQNPNWINKGIAGQTSGQILARFQTDVIDLHPSIVNIITGTYDVSTPGWDPECGSSSPPSTATCANLTAMVQMATAAGIKVIVGTIPPYGNDSSSIAFANSELFDRGLRQMAGVGVGGDLVTIFNNPNVALVDEGRAEVSSNGIDPDAAGYATMTNLVQEMVNLFPVTLVSGYLGNPGSVNTIASGGTIQFTAYGVYSDGSTRAVDPNIYYEGPANFSTNNGEVMQINQTTGLATAESPGQAWIFVGGGGIEFSPWVVTVSN